MDRIIKAISKDGSVRAFAIDSRDIVSRAMEIHNLSNTAAAALGRVLSAAGMMGSDLKSENASITLQIKGGGPLGTIVAVSDQSGNVRGYLQNPAIELPPRADGKIAVGAGVGNDGYLSVIRDLNMREPYIGQVALVSGEIAEDITRYFVESEQVPTVCALGVLLGKGREVIQAGGYIIQLLPGAREGVADILENNIAASPSFTVMRQNGLSLEDILSSIMEGLEPVVLEEKPVEYRCACSRERVERALISLGKSELTDMINEQKGAELTCQFCDRVYRFSECELADLLENAGDS